MEAKRTVSDEFMKPNSKTYADILTRIGLPIGVTDFETKTRVHQSHGSHARPDAPTNISKSPAALDLYTTRHNQTAIPPNPQQVIQQQHQAMILQKQH